MGRGVSCGGGQSSLGYLFGGNEAPKPAKESVQAAATESKVASKEPSLKPNTVPQPVDISKQVPAGIHSTSSTTNNYLRADGQNTCNFITDRPSTRSMLPLEEARLWVTYLVMAATDGRKELQALSSVVLLISLEFVSKWDCDHPLISSIIVAYVFAGVQCVVG